MGSNELQWGEMGENHLGDLFLFLSFKCFYCIFGLYIIPKWLINDSGWIPILLDDFGNFESFIES